MLLCIWLHTHTTYTAMYSTSVTLRANVSANSLWIWRCFQWGIITCKLVSFLCEMTHFNIFKRRYLCLGEFYTVFHLCVWLGYTVFDATSMNFAPGKPGNGIVEQIQSCVFVSTVVLCFCSCHCWSFRLLRLPSRWTNGLLLHLNSYFWLSPTPPHTLPASLLQALSPHHPPPSPPYLFSDSNLRLCLSFHFCLFALHLVAFCGCTIFSSLPTCYPLYSLTSIPTLPPPPPPLFPFLHSRHSELFSMSSFIAGARSQLQLITEHRAAGTRSAFRSALSLHFAINPFHTTPHRLPPTHPPPTPQTHLGYTLFLWPCLYSLLSTSIFQPISA